MQRRLRIILALVFLMGITFLFLGIGQGWWSWMAKVQLLPAIYRIVGGAVIGNLAIVAGILLITVLFGRVYCSIICPLGVFQDVIIRIRRTLGKLTVRINGRRAKRAKAAGSTVKPVLLKPMTKHFSYSPEQKTLRYFFFAVFISTAIAVGQLLISFVAPYSAYGRMVQAVAGLSTGQTGTALLVTAVATFVIISVCAWLWGRIWCNTVCPVGTLLGYVSKAAVFKIRIDESKCAACGRCGRGCKASCIDMDAHRVDYSRCIGCFDCIDNCSEGAINFTKYRKKDE